MSVQHETEILMEIHSLLKENVDAEARVLGLDDLDDSPILVVNYHQEKYAVAVMELDECKKKRVL